jgi:flagellar biosynthetic protein FlhB
MAETAGDKSFEPTPHRRQKAREKGQVAFSHDLGSAVLLVLAALALLLMGGPVIDFTARFMRYQLGEVAELAPTPAEFASQGRGILMGLAGVLLPLMGLLMVGGILANVLQVGLLYVPERVAPDISRLSPLKGLQRIFSLAGTMRLGFGLFKVAVIVATTTAVVWHRWKEVLYASELSTLQYGQFLVDMAMRTMLWVGVALVVLAIFDYAFQRWKQEQDLRMTRQELREEMKDLQGDPQIIARRRSVQRQMVLNRVSSSVPKADVVVTNPTELAVAIQYDPLEMAAPIVVAKGAGVIAQRIRKLALEHHIPIVERKPLAQLLYKEVKVGRPIPDKSYAAVAEVLAYVYQLQGKKLPKAARAA